MLRDRIKLFSSQDFSKGENGEYYPVFQIDYHPKTKSLLITVGLPPYSDDRETLIVKGIVEVNVVGILEEFKLKMTPNSIVFYPTESYLQVKIKNKKAEVKHWG